MNLARNAFSVYRKVVLRTVVQKQDVQYQFCRAMGKKHGKDDKKKKPSVIVDVDAGSDDAIALLMLIAAHKRGDIKLKAITCVAGNTALKNVKVNVLRLMDAMKLKDVPVFAGAASPFLPVKVENPDELGWHGKDGFGDLKHDKTPDVKKRICPEHASNALVNLVKKYPNQLTLIFLGPLTNGAIAAKLDPKFLECIKTLYIMGGNYRGEGNISNAAEFNFGTDPEAAHIMISEYKKQCIILPWETCKHSKLTAEWRMKTMGKIDNPYMKLLNAVEASVFKMHPHVAYEACDPSTVAAMLNPHVIKKTIEIHVQVELNGKLTRGQMVLDHNMMNKKDKKGNAKIITELNIDVFKKMLMQAAGHKDGGGDKC